MAFQPEVMVCPPGRVKTSDQPLTAVVPVFVMVMFSVRPVFQALTVAVTRQAPDVGGVVGRCGGRRSGRCGRAAWWAAVWAAWWAAAAWRCRGEAEERDRRTRPCRCRAGCARRPGCCTPRPGRCRRVGVAAAVPVGLRGVGGRRCLAQPEHVGPLLDRLLQQRVRHEGVVWCRATAACAGGGRCSRGTPAGPRRPTAAGSGSCCRRCTGCCRAGSRPRWRSS